MVSELDECFHCGHGSEKHNSRSLTSHQSVATNVRVAGKLRNFITKSECCLFLVYANDDISCDVTAALLVYNVKVPMFNRANNECFLS